MTSETKPKAPPVDILYGADQIADALNMTVAQVYHLHARKEIPTFKVGYRVCARRSHLDEWFERIARRAIEGGCDE